MNVSILICSFKYINNNFDLLILLNSWIYDEICQIKYTDDKLINSFDKNELDVSESIIYLNENNDVLDFLLSKSLGYNVMNLYRRIKILLEAGADVHVNDNYVLKLSCYLHGGYPEIIKLLLLYNVDIHFDNEYVLIQSIMVSNIEIVKIALEANADVHARNEEPLAMASYFGNTEIIKLLLQFGADIHARSDSVLKQTIFWCYLEPTRLFLELYDDVSHIDGSSLIFAINTFPNNKTKMIKLLQEYGIYVSDKNELSQ